MSVQITVSEEFKKVADKIAKKHDSTVGEACDRIAATYLSRITALANYAAKHAKAPKEKKAKAVKKGKPSISKKAPAKKAKATPHRRSTDAGAPAAAEAAPAAE
jgi:hypothetical protein